MYSKEKGFSYVPPAPPSYHRPLYRQPARAPLQVPSNYSGHAIVDGEERPLGRMEAESSPLAPELPTPHFEDLPRISHGGEPLRRPSPRTLTPTVDPPDGDLPAPVGGFSAAGIAAAELPAESRPAPSPDRPRPPSLPSRFPFGHGLGLEELFLLGLILFLLHEGEEYGRGNSDLDETVILLGLLLFLG